MARKLSSLPGREVSPQVKGKRSKGEEKKGNSGSQVVPTFLKRGTHMSKKGLSIVGTSLPSPPVTRVRVVACTVSTPPPAASASAPKVELETTMARPERSGLTSFILRLELGGTSSILEAVATPPNDSLAGFPACPSMSPGYVLHAFTQEGDGCQ
ncbi:hypothetical protein AMTR_s00134p00072450 [Amborella trichopoda]|uniref:Uncharacterized protein n=1 Tax=Amborella trichopoda TaxID=13333 RepID=W1NZC3_AMBTC|nr:hypothetical protein AMTR_s00134p00072450 [Amborella trichopoda]